MSDVSVIIVNYGTADLALKAARSALLEQVDGQDVDVHLVDNASPGSDAQVLQEAVAQEAWAARLTLHIEAENHGFGRGNNVVLRQLAERAKPPEHVFFLNPDAYVSDGALQTQVDFLRAHPKAGFVGACIEKPQSGRVTAAFRFPNIAAEFASAIGFGPISRLFSNHRVPLSPELAEGQVDWVAGAAVMARLTVLKELDFYDPAYFLYFEEVDLMHRARKAGWETWYAPDALVYHTEGAATGVKSGVSQRKRKPSYWYDSWQMYYVKNYGRAYAICAALAWIIGAGGNHVIALLRRREPSAPLNFFGDFWSVAGRSLLGLKVWSYDNS